MERILSQKFRLLFGLIIGSFLLLTTLPVQADSYEHIEQFDAQYKIKTDGSMLVTERILYDFGNEDRHGIFRTIPNRFSYGIDFVNLQIDILDVTDENGVSYQYEETGFETITVKIGDPDATISGQHWYVITYTAYQVVQSYSQHDELYWNVTGTDWDVPINHVTATVTLPESGDQSQYQTGCYAGSYGTTSAKCTTNAPTDGVFTYAADNLSSYNGLTIVAGFQPELVTNPFRPTLVDEFIADVEILPDGTADVLILFHLRYNILYSGSYWPISINRNHALGNALNDTLNESNEFQDIVVESITDYDGNPYNFNVIEDTDPYQIIIEDPSPTIDRWFSVRYTIPHAIDQLNDPANTDELLLDIIHDDWPTPIENVTAFVSLPDNATTSKHDQWCTVDYDFSDSTACTTLTPDLTVDQPNQWAYAVDYLDANTTLTIDLQFDSGIVTPNAVLNVTTVPDDAKVYVDDRLRGVRSVNRIRTDGGEHTVRVEKNRFIAQTQTVSLTAGETTQLAMTLQKSPFWVLIETYLPIGLFGLGGLGLLLWWWAFGRDPKGRGTIIPQYEAPEHMTPGEVGVVIDSRAHIHDITATIIDLAVRGYITIKKTGKNTFTFIKQKEIDDECLPFETELFRAIFPQTNTQERKLSDMKNKFYTHLPEIRRGLYRQTIKAGYYTTAPNTVRALYITLAVLGGGILIYGALFLSAFVGSGWYALLAGLAVEGFILSFVMTKRTKKGVLAYEHSLGLKQYLTVAEQSRIKFHQSPEAYQHHFEALLPYAMVLKVEKDWAKLFEGMFTKPMNWLQDDTGGAFNMILLMNTLSSFEHSTASAVTSAPSGGSGGSGFSGGGFSGGGFGGGGGGSW